MPTAERATASSDHAIPVDPNVIGGCLSTPIIGTHLTPGFVGVQDYLRLPREKEAWLIKPLIPVGGAALLFSPPKTGKSAVALQLAHAISTGQKEWMGFPVLTHGRVLYLQQDTPRSTWTMRLEAFQKNGFTFNSDLMKMSDRDSLAYYPFDILQPQHMDYLAHVVRAQQPVRAVFIDTLRKIHTGNENDSTVMSNVVSNLIKAVNPAALILISHDRKPSPDVEKDIMSDHRGSTSVVGEMDGIIRLTKSRMYYAGRSIEEGSIKLVRRDSQDALIWDYDREEYRDAIISVLDNQELSSMRAKARELSKMINKSEEAAMSILRRQTIRTSESLKRGD